MGQFWGLSIGDDALVPCAVRRYIRRIAACTENAGSYGLGCYTRGELLQRVEPRCEGGPPDVDMMLDKTRADLVIMHARPRKDHPANRADIHPFRFKEWLFAHNGEVKGFEEIKQELLEVIPSFIRRNIKGETDSEVLFHLFLSFLYDAGKLGRPAVKPTEISDALVRTFATVDEFAHIRNIQTSPASVIVSDGYSMAAGRRGIPMELAVIDGIPDCDRCRVSFPPGDREAPPVNHEVKAVLVCSCNSVESDETLTVVEDNTLLLVDRHQSITYRPFGS